MGYKTKRRTKEYSKDVAEQLGEWSCHLLRRKRQRSRFEGGNQVIRHINLEMPLQLQSGDRISR